MSKRQQPPDGGLPTATSEFIGRQAEVHRINTLLSGPTRLLTFVGPGGIGKTRLAAEALRRHRTPRPIHWTRLARIARAADAAIVAEEIARSIAKIDIPGQSAWAVLVDTLATDDAPVLVLDNCEHVTTGAGMLIADLLEAVPSLTVLATSREPVGWVDEHILAVPPLPPAQALELFLHRADRTGNPIADDPDQIAVAQQICRHVDHNPLFIRLAAARLRYQPPSIVLDELTGDAADKRMNWSHPASVGIDERHRGVRDVIAWSYGLCRDDERLLLDRLSVFAAGYEIDTEERGPCGVELEAIEAVCADDALPAERIEGVLERLVERSLVSVHLTASTVRYFLLESVRVFAHERLLYRGNGAQRAADLAGKHRRYYRDKFVAGQTMWQRPDGHDWVMNWARPAWDNVLIAIETSLTDPAEAVVGLEIANILLSIRMLFVKSDRTITRLAERALEATSGVQPPPRDLRIAATAQVAWIALFQGRSAYTAELLDECVAVCLPDSDVRRTWRETAETDIGLPAAVEFTWGLELYLAQMDPRAVTVLDRARHKAAAGDDLDAKERGELLLALASTWVGNKRQALDNTERFLERAETLGSGWLIAWAMMARSIALSRHGHAAEALALAHEALVHHVSPGDTWTASWVLGARFAALTRILADRLADGAYDRDECFGLATEIGRLVGGFRTQHRSMGSSIDRVPAISAGLQLAEQVASAVLGHDGYIAAENQGARLRPEFDELQQYVLGKLDIDRSRERYA